MSDAEELRALLDERGAEYVTRDGKAIKNTYWNDGRGRRFGYAADDSGVIEDRQLFLVRGRPDFTPAQAVEATLGRGECEWMPVESCHDFAGEGWGCSNCGHEEGDYGRERYAFCPMCGAKVVER